MWAELMLALGKTGELKAGGATRGVWLFEALDFHPKHHRRWSARNMPEKRSRHFNSHLGSIFFDFFGALDIEVSEIETLFECLILVILNPWKAWKDSICCKVQGCGSASLHSGVATGKLFKLQVLSWCVFAEAWDFFSKSSGMWWRRKRNTRTRGRNVQSRKGSIPCCRYDSDSCQFKSQIIFILQLRLNVSDVFVGSLFLWNNQLEGFDSLAESWGQSWYCSSFELRFFFSQKT